MRRIRSLLSNTNNNNSEGASSNPSTKKTDVEELFAAGSSSAEKKDGKEISSAKKNEGEEVSPNANLKKEGKKFSTHKLKDDSDEISTNRWMKPRPSRRNGTGPVRRLGPPPDWHFQQAASPIEVQTIKIKQIEASSPNRLILRIDYFNKEKNSFFKINPINFLCQKAMIHLRSTIYASFAIYNASPRYKTPSRWCMFQKLLSGNYSSGYMKSGFI